MRLPAKEDDPLLALLGAAHGGEHARLAGLHQLEVLEAETVGLDHLGGAAVGAAARLDAVDLAAELVLEAGDVGKGLQAPS